MYEINPFVKLYYSNWNIHIFWRAYRLIWVANGYLITKSRLQSKVESPNLYSNGKNSIWITHSGSLGPNNVLFLTIGMGVNSFVMGISSTIGSLLIQIWTRDFMENNTFRKTQNGFSNNLAKGKNKHVIILKIWLPKSRFHYKTLTIEDISFVKKKKEVRKIEA